MATLPRIPGTTQYLDSFIVSLGLSTTFSPFGQSVQIQLRPYNYDTGVVMPGPDANPSTAYSMDTTYYR